MKVLEYLNEMLPYSAWHECLEELTREYGIKVTSNPLYPELIVLNYDQCDSPKTEPIVRECRSLVLAIPEGIHGIAGWEMIKPFTVVSRAFDRFYNINEVPETMEDNLDFNDLLCYEKVDGSLVTLFYTKKYGWLYRTKSMIMPEGLIKGDLGRTWKDLIEVTTNFPICTMPLDEEFSYIMEVWGEENRVVTKYDAPFATLLAARRNSCGTYMNKEYLHYGINPLWFLPSECTFSSSTECLEDVAELKNLEEGHVVYNSSGVPVCKVKSPAYVAAHRLRGNGLCTSKSIMDLIFMNEQAEYLSIFPEDYDKFQVYEDAFYKVHCQYIDYITYCESIKDQKEFALLVNKEAKSVAGLLFRKRQNPRATFQTLFDSLTTPAKYRMVESYLDAD